MDARRHQVVARALGRGRREDRRLELGEALALHAVAQAVDDAAAQHDVLVQAFAAEVEKTVLEPRLLRVFLVGRDRHRKFGRRAEHFDFGRIDFDLSGRHLGILGAARPPAHGAVDPDDPLGAKLLGLSEGGRIRVHDDLGHAVVIAQIDEQQTAVVTDPVAPPGEPHGGTDVGFAQSAAGMGAVAVHGGLSGRLRFAQMQCVSLHSGKSAGRRRSASGGRLVKIGGSPEKHRNRGILPCFR